MKTIIYPTSVSYSPSISTHIVSVPLNLRKYIPVALTFCLGKVTEIYTYKFKFHNKDDVSRFINALREERKDNE